MSGQDATEESEDIFTKKQKSLEELKLSRTEKLKFWLEDMIDGWTLQVMINVLTVVALIGDDIRMAWIPTREQPWVDQVFWSIIAFAFVLFTIEFIVYSQTKKEQSLSFFFQMDLLALMSLVPDIGFIMEPLLQTSAGVMGGSGEGDTEGDDSATSVESLKTIARTARASRTGTKSARILRVLRLVRLLRFIKIYKAAQKLALQRDIMQDKLRKQRLAAQEQTEETKLDDVGKASIQRKIDVNVEDDEEDIEIDIPTETKVSKKLAGITQIRVISLIMSVIFALPFLEENMQFQPYLQWEYEINLLPEILQRTPQHFAKAFDQFVYNNSSNKIDSDQTWSVFMIRIYNPQAVALIRESNEIRGESKNAFFAKANNEWRNPYIQSICSKNAFQDKLKDCIRNPEIISVFDERVEFAAFIDKT